MVDLIGGAQTLLPGAAIGWAASEGMGWLRRRADRRRTTADQQLQLADDILTATLTFASSGASLADAIRLEQFHGITVGKEQHAETVKVFNDAGHRVEILAARVGLRGPIFFKRYADDLTQRCRHIVNGLNRAKRAGGYGEPSEASQTATAVQEECEALRQHVHFLVKVYQDSV